MTNLEQISITAVSNLVMGEVERLGALRCIRLASNCETVSLDRIMVHYADESAMRHVGVLVRGTIFATVSDEGSCDCGVFDFDAFVSFKSGSAQVIEMNLDDWDPIDLAA